MGHHADARLRGAAPSSAAPGTRSAVAERAVGRAAEVLVANGDFDPVTQRTCAPCCAPIGGPAAAASLLTAEMDDPGGYGRVIRD